MNREKYISQSNLNKFLQLLGADYNVFVLAKKEKQLFFKRYTQPADNIVIGEVRPFEPLKAFFTKGREIVAFGFSADIPHAEKKPFAIVGVKACDLKGFKVQDYVFNNHDYQDPFYLKARQENLIISADCTYALDTCFCLALGVKPHPLEDFDLNLSQVKDGFVVEIGSKKGEALVDRNFSLFEQAAERLLRHRDEQRAKVAAEVEKNIQQNF